MVNLLGTPISDDALGALGLLGFGMAAGNFPQGGLLAMKYLDEAPDRRLKNQLTTAQIADFANQAKLRDIQAQQAQFDMDLIKGIQSRRNGAQNGGVLSQPATEPTPGGALGSGTFGIPTGGQPAMSAPTQSGGAGSAPAPMGTNLGGDWLTGLQPQDLAALKLAKRDLTDVYKLATDPVKMEPGLSYNRFTGKITSIPYVSQDGKSVQIVPNGNGGYRTEAVEGAPEAYGQFVGAGKRAENENSLLPPTYVSKGTKEPIGGTVGAYIRNTTPLPVNQGNLQLTPQLAAAIRDDALKNGITNPQVNLNLPAGKAQNPQIGLAKPGDQQNVPEAPQLQGPSEAKFNEKVATNEADQINESLTKAMAAKQALPVIWTAQNILKDGTFNGLGSDAKLNLVRSLSALGIPVPDSVANSQQFDALLAQIAGKNIKSIVGSQNISNSDVNFVRQMFGTRGQEAKAIQFLLQKAEEANFRDLNTYNDLSRTATENGGQTRIGELKPPERPQVGGAVVKSDAEYNALPSGTVFTGPDGKKRRKP